METSAIAQSSVAAWDGVERRQNVRCESCATFASSIQQKAESIKPQGLIVDVLGIVAAVVLGLAVFNATGLAEAESGLVKVVIGGATVLWMVGMVRLGLSAR